jgi:hypothetical protein
MISILVGSLAMMALMSVMFFSARSFAALTNYVDLDNHSRTALDVMTREIRQANGLIEGDTQRLVFSIPNDDGAADTVTFRYDPRARQLTRECDGEERVLLRECDQLRFAVYQRHPISGTYDQWREDWSNPDQVKVVQLMWTCSRDILGARVNTESVQSAKVVIRKK